jgi:hypothetical protein
MTTWEIDIELRVRKTLIFGGPATEEAARAIAATVLRGEMPIVPLLKWEPDGHGYGRHPVETIIDNDPQIVAVREVAGDD